MAMIRSAHDWRAANDPEFKGDEDEGESEWEEEDKGDEQPEEEGRRLVRLGERTHVRNGTTMRMGQRQGRKTSQ